MHLYLITGLLMALGVAKWGAGESYFLAAIVASSVLTGRLCDELIASRRAVSDVLPVVLLAQCLISAHGELSRLVPALPDRGLQASALAPEPTLDDLERGQGI